MVDFAALQDGLAEARAAHRTGSTVPHTVVVLPSYSVGPSLQQHYAHRIPAMEHRFLVATLALGRIPGCEVVLVTSLPVAADVVGYYCRLADPDDPDSVGRRLHLVALNDPAPRGLSAKLLDRPDLVAHVRSLVAGRRAFLAPWNVTRYEVVLAHALGLPLDGCDPALLPLAHKSTGRDLLREAGVPLPAGWGHLTTPKDVATAMETLRTRSPAPAGLVVKLDDSASGDGNHVVPLTGRDTGRDLVERLPSWFRDDLRLGAVVEELVDGTPVTTPSVQLDVRPDHTVRVLATHEQLMGGRNGQAFSGCTFPADPAYSPALAVHGRAAGELFARYGATGRLSLDFVARHGPKGAEVFGLEVNLRKGGTWHPLVALHNLVPGRYDEGSGRWLANAGGNRCYLSDDDVADPAWRGLPARDVLAAAERAGVGFDRGTGTGVVLHTLVGLEIDGHFGLTAIAHDLGEAWAMRRAVVEALRS